LKKSDVFVSIDGVLKAVVKQKTPVARVMNGDRSFYIEYEGGKMPLSNNFAARVPLSFGKINKKNSEEIAQLCRVIYDDDFENITAIQIMPWKLKMFNRNYNYQIEFGSLDVSQNLGL
jgi:cell division protein FtsQ